MLENAQEKTEKAALAKFKDDKKVQAEAELAKKTHRQTVEELRVI